MGNEPGHEATDLPMGGVVAMTIAGTPNMVLKAVSLTL